MELEASGLQIGYGEHVIVNQMDVSIARDKITTIIGPNGSGKSTLLKALTRFVIRREMFCWMAAIFRQ